MKAIVAVDREWGIGKGNDLLFSIPEDMKFFRTTTMGKVIVIGRKTLESFPGGKPLKNRTNVVLTRNGSWDGVISVNGILNGTTNYILTSMKNDGASFSDALKEAQRLGYAEANPSADVDGIDAARKIVILAALASGKLADPKKIPTTGITAITLTDTKIAELFGCSIKLIGHATVTDDGKLTAFVSPRMVPSTNPLSTIDDVFNGILVNANMVGDVMFYGPGAGKLPTASAVVADIIDIIANRNTDVKAISFEAATETDINDFGEYSCKRVFITNAECKDLCGDVKEFDGIYGTMTKEMTENEANKLVEKLGNKLISVYRVL